MSLYETLAGRYDEIFPVNRAAIGAIESWIPGSAPRRLLDLGSATGGHVLEFAGRGFEALGIESSRAMTAIARDRAAAWTQDPVAGAQDPVHGGAGAAGIPVPRFVQGDMRLAADIAASEFGRGSLFGAVLCLGNTLPHLSPGDLVPFFGAVGALLHPGAPLVLQTLNYAHPEIGPGYRFPDIRIPGLVFSRRYAATGAAEPGRNTVARHAPLAFETRVETDSGEFRDVTILHPFTPGEIREALSAAGAARVTFRAGWTEPAFDIDSDRYVMTIAAW